MEIIQGILIIALSVWMVWDQQGLVVTTWFPIMVALFAGIIMGDMTTAMVIGGTFQLMALGVANIGGSSVPNWGLAALVGIYVAIRTTNNIEEAKAVALAVGVPVGMLGIQLDVLAKILNTYVTHAAQNAANKMNFKKMNRILWIGPAIFGLSTAIPTALCVIFGDRIVNLILNFVPKWFTDGLSIAGSMLPVVGIALLLQVMPVKKYLTMLLIGFVLAAYLNLPILGVSIVGFALAYYFFTTEMKKSTPEAPTETGIVDEGDDFDE
ncbi:MULTISPECIES: PTS mannose/fructose/sorbose/N-acetylgalactosamine transporter subunit IIC [Enterococcus]|uniref:PTS system, mannose-specific IIC component n=1 Tax=Candidatus Enterococcus ferrettii TaxID=2815324 RepID=A0ABV0EU51_9ENTE|nr:PTS sugar transporter subunit IIC [Enterococcus sp. 665A]MBO1339817.1 PTS sugar transporter subunit IIC [Enterococcus sp. 665A]